MILRNHLPSLAQLFGLFSLPTFAPPASTSHRVLQRCQLAGFDHHEGAALWSYLTVGDSLELHREPANPHDAHAVRVDWNGRKLGYIPHRENQTVARLMDQGTPLEARIGGLERHANPWRRVTVEVWTAGWTTPQCRAHRRNGLT